MISNEINMKSESDNDSQHMIVIKKLKREI